MEFKEFIDNYQSDLERSIFMCQDAYDDKSSRILKNIQWSTKIIDNNLYIAFAGTNSLVDLLYDLNVSRKVLPYDNEESSIKVHSGFINMYKKVRNFLLTTYFYDPNYDKIFISGHSMGGSLALLLALDLNYNFGLNHNLFLITFGQPKVGNEAFCNSTNRRLKNYFRFVNSSDSIPNFPFFRYYHCGKQIDIGRKSSWKLFSLKDHSIDEYIENLIKV